MAAVLEALRLGSTSPERFPLERKSYVLGSRDSGGSEQYISIRSSWVRPEHAILEYSPNGWYLVAKQGQVYFDDSGDIETGKYHPIPSNGSFRIADVRLRLVETESAVEVQGGEDLPARLIFDRLSEEIQLRASDDMEELTGKLERAGGEGHRFENEDDRREKLLPIIEKHLQAALDRTPPDVLDAYAVEALRRELIWRVLGHPGLFHAPYDPDVAPRDREELKRFCGQIAVLLDLSMIPGTIAADLEKLRRDIKPIYLDTSIRFDRGLITKLVAEAFRFAVMSAMAGIGSIQALLGIEDVSEVMVVSHDKVFVELDGKLLLTGLGFQNAGDALTTAKRIAINSNTSVEKQHPYRDARLPDGSRVNIVIDPISLSGTTITIRKFRAKAPNLMFLRRKNSLSAAMASFMKGCVVAKKNIVVSGGTGTGKTTVVNFLCSMIPPHERIVTVEDTAELKISDAHGGVLPHVVTLQSVAETGDSKGHSIRALVKNALRMRPDRIIVGECRGKEAFDMLQAMNTGHDGSMTTLHANSPEDAISRLESLVLTAEDLPVDAIRFQIASAIDYIVQLKRYADGKKKILCVSEVGKVDTVTGRIEVNPIFETVYNPNFPARGTQFDFAGRTPAAIREIIEGGFNPDRLSF